MNSEIKTTVGLDIEKKFKGRSRNKRIAESCLLLADEWATVRGDAIQDFTKSQAKKACKKYIKENLKEEIAGNPLVTMLVSLIVKLIIEWVVENYITKLFKK